VRRSMRGDGQVLTCRVLENGFPDKRTRAGLPKTMPLPTTRAEFLSALSAMSRAEVISALALLVAFSSLLFSGYVALRDRRRFRARCRRLVIGDYPVILVHLGNAGRRPISFQRAGLLYLSPDGDWLHEDPYVGTLGENEGKEFRIDGSQLVYKSHDVPYSLKHFEIVDSFGRKYQVKSWARSLRWLHRRHAHAVAMQAKAEAVFQEEQRRIYALRERWFRDYVQYREGAKRGSSTSDDSDSSP
jgi:hypothetical protein